MIKIDGAGRRFQRIPLIGKLEKGWLPANVLRRGGRWRCGLSSGLALRREIADRLFPLPEGLGRAPDGFVCMVAPFLTPVKVIHKPLAYYRVHGKNLGATHRADRSHFERTLRAARDVLDAANDRLGELGFEFRIHPNENAFMAELTFALRVLDGSEPRHELAAAFRDLRRRLRAEGVYGERELFLVSVLFGTAILLPEPLRTAWVERARSVRLPRVFQRLASRADV